MARWQPDARGRLAEAALALYVEHGFEGTTVADIAARAGLTERTFFRHFADKREVLFGGAEQLRALLVTTLDATPPDSPPLRAVAAALGAAGAALQQHPERSRLRQGVIDANTELQERELIKLASLAGAMTDALRRRGVADPAARLTAEAGIAAFRVAFETWVGAPTERDLPSLVAAALDDLRDVTADR